MKLLSKFLFIFVGLNLFSIKGLQAQDRSILLEEETIFKVFPNPNQENNDAFVSLTGFKAEDLLVVVYDLMGREIYSKVEVRENDGFLFTISSDGNRLSEGIYLIIASANDQIFRQKLIVK